MRSLGEDGLRPLAAPGVSAQALHHLNYLIADPIPAVVLNRLGVLAQIPGRLKAEKDRRQACFLIEALAEDRPADLHEAYQDALSRGPRWRDRIASILRFMPDIAGSLG